MPIKNFSEREIKNAIDNTRSFHEAARYLNSSYNTFKKYAKLYNLWIQGGKNPSAKGIPKEIKKKRKKRKLEDILAGKYNDKRVNVTRLKSWIISECALPEECSLCGFNEKRITDYTVPLYLVFADGDRKNYKAENIKFLCHNCYYLTEGNISGRNKDYYTGEEGEIYETIE